MNPSKTRRMEGQQRGDPTTFMRTMRSHRKRKPIGTAGVPCSGILNETYMELEVSRSHETILDKVTLTCRSADRKVISGRPGEWVLFEE